MKVTFNRKWRVGSKKFATEQEAQDYVNSKRKDNWTLAEETSPSTVSTQPQGFFAYPSNLT